MVVNLWHLSHFLGEDLGISMDGRLKKSLLNDLVGKR